MAPISDSCVSVARSRASADSRQQLPVRPSSVRAASVLYKPSMGILSRLLNRAPKAPPMDVREIARAYGAVLASRKSMYADASALPYPKRTIKSALIAALSVIEDAQTREDLKAAYVMLAEFQEGIGAGPYPWELSATDSEGVDAIKRIVDAGSSFTEMPGKVAAESQALLDELKALGF
jgi:hypothetical protein